MYPVDYYTREEALVGYYSLCRYLDDRYDMALNPDVWLKKNISWFGQARNAIIDFLTEDEIKSLSSKTKSRLQAEANLAHRNSNRWGLICMATGTGKSKTAIDAIISLVNFKPDAKILIVVPTAKLRDKTWKNEFIDWKVEHIWEHNVEKICYKSLHKEDNVEYDFVVLDEVHNLTERAGEFFDYDFVNTRYCMALTATPPENRFKQMLLSKLRLQLIYEITLDEAVQLGVVAPYEITVIQTELDSIRRNVQIKTKTKNFYVSESKNYEYYASIENSDDPKVKLRANKFFYINRMRFIYNLNSKFEAAQWLLKNVIPQDKRTLIFCGSIDHADRLCLNTYHSKSGTEGYNKFIGKKVNRLACVEALNEGDNIPNVDIAFIDQLNSNGQDLIQRIGRIIRYEVGHTGKIIILCVKNTVDAKWTVNALAGLDKSKVRWIEYKDILEGKETLTF